MTITPLTPIKPWLASFVLGGTILVNPAFALELQDGTTYFAQPPSLDQKATQTTDDTIRSWSATYAFTLNLPENAGEPLDRIVIQQREGFDRELDFDLKKTQAYEGTLRRPGKMISLGEVTHQKETQILTVTFDPPVAPGRILTIELQPEENPQYSGVYLFGVTAFPRGEKGHSQFLGYARFHFYSGSCDS